MSETNPAVLTQKLHVACQVISPCNPPFLVSSVPLFAQVAIVHSADWAFFQAGLVDESKALIRLGADVNGANPCTTKS